MQNSKRFWEVPEIDLNLRHYSGHPSDVIKLLKMNIENYLKKPEVSQRNREVYSAVYNSLNYYKNILSSSHDFETDKTFLNSTIQIMKNDYNYLSQLYNSHDFTMPPVISMNGRIKSLISAVEKIKNKISEYLENGTDLRYLNESLRDFMGVRIVVNPSKELTNLAPEAEYMLLQSVLIDLLNFHGIKNQSSQFEYKFITINTKNHPNKLEKMRSDRNPDFLPEYLVPFVKNYVDHPKSTGYQSYHICVTPKYSDCIKQDIVPSYIIPPMPTEYSFEYQVRSKTMDISAQYGLYSHSDYKKLGAYHRLSIPFYIDFKSDSNRFEELNLEESCQKYFGYVPFLRIYNESGVYLRNINFTDFNSLFTINEQNLIIDGKKSICQFENTADFTGKSSQPLVTLVDTTTPILLTDNEIESLKKSKISYESILENANITDSVIASTSPKNSNTQKNKIEIYTLETSENRVNSINDSTRDNSADTSVLVNTNLLDNTAR